MREKGNGRLHRAHRFLIFVLFFVAACAGRDEPAYLPPTAVSQAAGQGAPVQTLPASTARSEEQTATPGATPTPACASGLAFLSDLTIPDGTVVAPQELLDKRWQIENSGTCNWDASYSLRLIAGPDLGAPSEQALFPARSGTQATVRMFFTAPAEPGTYRSAWQAFDPQGEPFGDPFFVEVVVE
jgi:hypothetical protein